MTHPFILASILPAMALTVAACGPRPSLVASPSVPVAAQPAAAPSIVIAAAGSRVRAVIVARAQARGATIAANTPQGVALEGPLAQTTEVLEAQCGPHQAGRKQRILLATSEGLGSTTVTEQRFVVDGSEVCPLQLSAAEVAAGNRRLQDLRNQVLGVPPPQAGAPVAPATPRT